MPAGDRPSRRPSRSSKRASPNVLVVVLDTLSEAGAGIGRVPSTMPSVERLAESGTVFTHAVTNAPWTYPAHASLLTGMLPSQHGMSTRRQIVIWDREVGMASIADDVLARGPKRVEHVGERWLPALMARAGYETVLASNNPWVGRLTQMEHGFRLVRDTLSVRLAPRRRTFARRPGLRRAARSAYHAYRAVRGRGDLLGREAAERIAEWSRRRDQDRPFFLLVNLMEAHAPYLTPLSRGGLREAGADPLTVLRAMHLTEARSTIRANVGARVPGEADTRMRLLASLHRRAASYLDSVVDSIVRVAQAQAGELLVCVASDHGESFGQHGFMAHGFSMFEPGLRIPVVLSGAGVPAGEVSRTVELRQVYATVLSAAGLEPPGPTAPSLVDEPLDHVIAERDRVEVPAWAAQWGRTERTGRLRGVYRDRWKLIQTEAGRHLFDLAADPQESNDRSAHESGVVADLAAALPPWPADDPGPPESHGSSRGVSGLSAAEERVIADQLAALGYLE